MDEPAPEPQLLQTATENQPASAEPAPSPSENTTSLLSAEKLLIGVFMFFVGLTLFLIVVQSRWYYLTFLLSLGVMLVTYKEGLVAMEGG